MTEKFEPKKSPEDEFPKYENFSEEQKELLSGQLGIEDAETYEWAIDSGRVEEGQGDHPFTREEVREYIKQMLENEK